MDLYKEACKILFGNKAEKWMIKHGNKLSNKAATVGEAKKEICGIMNGMINYWCLKVHALKMHNLNKGKIK